MGATRKVTAPNGVQYPSISAMCEAYGVKLATYYTRRARGVPMAEALEKPADGGSAVGPDGVRYSSDRAMCEAYGVDLADYRARRRFGWSVTDSLFPSRRGREKRNVVDPEGRRYRSVDDMCRAHNIHPDVYRARIKEGMGRADALCRPTERGREISKAMAGARARPSRKLIGRGGVRKPVVCVETGEAFRAYAEAAEAVGRDYHGISRAVKTGGTCAGLHWRDAAERPRAESPQNPGE